MEIILINTIVYFVAFVMTFRKLKRDSTFYWLRLLAVFTSAYFFCVYFISLIGVVPSSDIVPLLRYFQPVAALYIILESKHG